MAKLFAEYKLNEEQLKQIKQIVPEAFSDLTLNNMVYHGAA